MNNHLNDDQLARSFIGRATSAERQHLSGCALCSAELETLGDSIARFRTSVRERVQVQLQPSRAVVSGGIPKWQWALVTSAFLTLALIPFFARMPEPPVVEEAVAMDPDTLMRSVNLSLSRTVPAPMEPLLVVLPGNDSIKEIGGVQ